MTRKILLVMSCGLLFGCAQTGVPIVKAIPASETICAEGVKGYTPDKITYRTQNKFEISVKLDFDVGEDTELRLKLEPKQGSEDAIVSIIGRMGELPNGNSTPFGWLDASGKASDFDDETIVLCVPPNLPVNTFFKFDVEVEDIGLVKAEIDPRVNVRR